MSGSGRGIWRIGASSVLVVMAFIAMQSGRAGAVPAQQDATPTTYSCDTAAPMATPGMDHGAMTGMAEASPMAGMDMEMEFDQHYIDMMIPHHQSIIALAEAALPHLTDERLQTIAFNIIDAQGAEIEELKGYREQFYGSAEPMPMDESMMGMMMEAFPGMGSMEDMAMQMDPEAQVAAFCAAGDPDLAFIDLVIPHHEMAIMSSETALTQATHQEIKDFAQTVIDAQQQEITELTAIRAELSGDATPSS